MTEKIDRILQADELINIAIRGAEKGDLERAALNLQIAQIQVLIDIATSLRELTRLADAVHIASNRGDALRVRQ